MPKLIQSACAFPGCPNKSDCPSHSRAKVYIVCGPPGSGKTTYVSRSRQPGDLAFDFDSIMAAITGLPLYASVEGSVPYVMNMRDGFMDAAIYGKPPVRAVWIIMSARDEEEIRYMQKDLHAEVIRLDVSEKECIRRTAERGPEWADIIRKWFRERVE